MPLERRLWSQPRSVTVCPSWRAMSSMYSSHGSASARSNRCRARPGLLEHRTGCAGVGQFHQIRADVADLLHRDERRVPVDRAQPRHEVSVILPAVVVHVRRDDVLRCRLDGVDHVAHQVRVAEIEADAGVPYVDLAFEHRRQGRRVRQLVRDDLHGHRTPRAPARLRRSPRGCGPPTPDDCRPRPLCEVGVPRCTTSTSNGIRSASFSAVSVSRTAASRALPVVHRVRVGRRPLVPLREEIRDRRMDAVERQPGFRRATAPAGRSPLRRDSRNDCAWRRARWPRSRKQPPAPGGPAADGGRDRGAWKRRNACPLSRLQG